MVMATWLQHALGLDSRLKALVPAWRCRSHHPCGIHGHEEAFGGCSRGYVEASTALRGPGWTIVRVVIRLPARRGGRVALGLGARWGNQ